MTSDPSISPTGGPPGDTTAADTLLIRTPRGAGVSGPTAPTGRRRHKSLGLPCGRRGCEGPPPPDPSPAGTQLGRRPKNCRQAPTTPGQWGQTEVPEEQLSRCSQGHGAERRRRKGKAGQEAPLGSALVGAPPPPRSLSLLRLLPALPAPLPLRRQVLSPLHLCCTQRGVPTLRPYHPECAQSCQRGVSSPGHTAGEPGGGEPPEVSGPRCTRTPRPHRSWPGNSEHPAQHSDPGQAQPWVP